MVKFCHRFFLFLGGSTGLATGFVVRKVGKITGIVIGGSVLILQVAQHFGYIQINWSKFQKDFEKQKNRTMKAIKNSDNAAVERFLSDSKSFLMENVSFALSFAGGLIVGFSF
jgi:FUN14 domain-containing protein 1